MVSFLFIKNTRKKKYIITERTRSSINNPMWQAYSCIHVTETLVCSFDCGSREHSLGSGVSVCKIIFQIVKRNRAINI